LGRRMKTPPASPQASQSRANKLLKAQGSPGGKFFRKTGANAAARVPESTLGPSVPEPFPRLILLVPKARRPFGHLTRELVFARVKFAPFKSRSGFGQKFYRFPWYWFGSAIPTFWLIVPDLGTWWAPPQLPTYPRSKRWQTPNFLPKNITMCTYKVNFRKTESASHKTVNRNDLP
jgi:hypothetical protein